MTREKLWPLGAMGFVLMVTVSWWTLALWSIPGAPEWLERTRSVCFNLTETGIPDRKGWLLLLGQPPTMIALLVGGWRKETMDSLAWMIARPQGRMTRRLRNWSHVARPIWGGRVAISSPRTVFGSRSCHCIPDWPICYW